LRRPGGRYGTSLMDWKQQHSITRALRLPRSRRLPAVNRSLDRQEPPVACRDDIGDSFAVLGCSTSSSACMSPGGNISSRAHTAASRTTTGRIAGADGRMELTPRPADACEPQGKESEAHRHATDVGCLKIGIQLDGVGFGLELVSMFPVLLKRPGDDRVQSVAGSRIELSSRERQTPPPSSTRETPDRRASFRKAPNSGVRCRAASSFWPGACSGDM
jgi:hypothetical protein